MGFRQLRREELERLDWIHLLLAAGLLFIPSRETLFHQCDHRPHRRVGETRMQGVESIENPLQILRLFGASQALRKRPAQDSAPFLDVFFPSGQGCSDNCVCGAVGQFSLDFHALRMGLGNASQGLAPRGEVLPAPVLAAMVEGVDRGFGQFCLDFHTLRMGLGNGSQGLAPRGEVLPAPVLAAMTKGVDRAFRQPSLDFHALRMGPGHGSQGLALRGEVLPAPVLAALGEGVDRAFGQECLDFHALRMGLGHASQGLAPRGKVLPTPMIAAIG